MANKRLAGTAWLVCGVLWLTLTGLCTWNLSHDGGYDAGFAELGAPIVGVGLLPVALGLERLFDVRAAGRRQLLAGAAWVLGSGALFGLFVMHDGPPRSLKDIGHYAIAGGLYVLPGLLTIWRGAILVRRANQPRP